MLHALPRAPRARLAVLLTALVVSALVLVAAAPPASAHHTDVVDITFPVAGPYDNVQYSDTFYAGRSGGRTHDATDIMAPKHRPVHAAVGGVVSWAPYPQPSYGWMVSVRGDDGFTYHYIHLNNDRKGSDDGRGGVDRAYAPKIADAAERKGSSVNAGDGVRVQRGELIGWVGDSGNAESTPPHLHFEIERNDHAYNPYESLRAAERRGDYPGTRTNEPPAGWTYSDVDPDSTHGQAITTITDHKIAEQCKKYRYCPSRDLTRKVMARYLAAAMGLDEVSGQRFGDVPAGHPYAGDINAIAEAGVAQGFNDGTFRPDEPVSRAQMATFLSNAVGLDDQPGHYFDDVDPTGPHAPKINAIAERQITSGCKGGKRYCPTLPVSRAQIATFIVNAFDL